MFCRELEFEKKLNEHDDVGDWRRIENKYLCVLGNTRDMRTIKDRDKWREEEKRGENWQSHRNVQL